MNVLVFSTLYPNIEQPHHGIFIEKRVLELRRRTSWHFEVVAPVPWFPLRGERWGRFGAYARVPRQDVRSGITVHHPRYLAIPGLSWRVAPVFLYLGARGLLSRLQRCAGKFDVIDAHFLFPDAVAAVQVGRKLGLPVIMTARGSDVNDSPKYALPRMFIRHAMRHAQCTMAVSQALAEKLRLLKDDDNPIPILANGVDADVFYPRDRGAARQRYQLDGRVVLSVGSLRRLKGHHLLIEAVAGLPGVTLVIAGGGDERAALEALARAHGIAERIRFLGVVDNSELPDLYAAADVFALASSNEGCPNVILEAMSCGLPIVATAVGAIPEMVPPETIAYLVQERSSRALREQLQRALDHPPEAALYTARARTFGWDATCNELARIMRGAAE